MPRKTDKRVRLVEAAKRLIHQQGFNLTTLADIAQEADVPLGNVYYYFKTKEAIGEAVIDKLMQELYERLSAWDALSEPTARLFSFVESVVENAEAIARFGCPVGGLCQELAKQGGVLADAAAKLLNDMLEWAEKQFRAMGYTDNARELALQFISRIQGMSLMTNTFRDPQLSSRIGQTINSWITKMADERTGTTTHSTEATAMA